MFTYCHGNDLFVINSEIISQNYTGRNCEIGLKKEHREPFLQSLFLFGHVIVFGPEDKYDYFFCQIDKYCIINKNHQNYKFHRKKL
jgi:hypothetical protein